MVAHFGLIDTKHQGIEDSRWEIISVNLTAFVWGNRLLGLLVRKEEQVTVGGGWNTLIEKGGGFESIFFPSSADVGLGGCTSVTDIYLAAIVMASLTHSSISTLPYQLAHVMQRACYRIPAADSGVLHKVFLYIGEVLTAIFDQTSR